MKPVRKPNLGMALGLAAMVLPAMAQADGDGRIYVSSVAESKLWALDAETLAIVAEIPIEGERHQMAVH